LENALTEVKAQIITYDPGIDNGVVVKFNKSTVSETGSSPILRDHALSIFIETKKKTGASLTCSMSFFRM
jgi:hypothetical protein